MSKTIQYDSYSIIDMDIKKAKELLNKILNYKNELLESIENLVIKVGDKEYLDYLESIGLKCLYDKHEMTITFEYTLYFVEKIYNELLHTNVDLLIEKVNKITDDIYSIIEEYEISDIAKENFTEEIFCD